jgi:hypothetical protein
MTEFITISEAANRTGKSQKSIRRAVQQMVAQDKRRADKHVRTIAQGKNHIYQVDADFIIAYFAKAGEDQRASTDTNATQNAPAQDDQRATDQLLKVLQDQLKEKDTQIAHLHDLIREEHILRKNLEDRLLLSPLHADNQAQVVKETENQEEPRKRKGFLGWIFGNRK